MDNMSKLPKLSKLKQPIRAPPADIKQNYKPVTPRERPQIALPKLCPRFKLMTDLKLNMPPPSTSTIRRSGVKRNASTKSDNETKPKVVAQQKVPDRDYKTRFQLLTEKHKTLQKAHTKLKADSEKKREIFESTISEHLQRITQLDEDAKKFKNSYKELNARNIKLLEELDASTLKLKEEITKLTVHNTIQDLSAQRTPQKNVGNICQCRPVITNNFVQGGQHQPSPQQANVPKQQVQQPQQHLPAQQQPPIQQQPPVQQQLQQLQLEKEQESQEQKLQQEAQGQEQMGDEGTNGTPMDVGEPKEKPFLLKTGGKITRREIVCRCNVRKSNILQPKNAVKILNELVQNTPYLIEELPVRSEWNQFKATVMYEGIAHVGYGRNKINAKNSAAEAALKHYVKTNKLTEVKKGEEGNQKMDVSEDETTQSPLSWQHVASFALYKLFSSWGENQNLYKVESGQIQSQNVNANANKPHENKPAKKMFENPETIDPLTLINRMLPHAYFEEIGKSENPPDAVFTFRCNVEGQSFVGMGPNKKGAKRMAAFGACHKVLSINYPPEIYVPSY